MYSGLRLSAILGAGEFQVKRMLAQASDRGKGLEEEKLEIKCTG